MQIRYPLLLAGVLAAVAAPASPGVQLDIDPDWNGFTHEAPVFLGEVTSQDAPLDPTSFRLFLDEDPVYRGDSGWVRDPGADFSYRATDRGGYTITWEYRYGCGRDAPVPEGSHQVRFEARDLAGNRIASTRPAVFRIDRTVPGARFEGLKLQIEDPGAGPVLDARLEAGPLAICPEPAGDRVRTALAGASRDWELEPESGEDRGLKVDIWRIDGPSFPGIREGEPLATEWVGRSILGTWSGIRYVADLAPAVERLRLPSGTGVSLVAYSTRWVLKGSGDLPTALVETLQGLGLPVRHDRRLNQVVVYAVGPQDRAGNALTPIVSTLHDGGPGHRPILDPPVATRQSGPGAVPPRDGRDRIETQGAQQATILAVTGAEVFPNPFNPFAEDAVIRFTLSEAATVAITAYDRTGAFVDHVHEGPGTAGVNTVPWGGQTEDGRKLGNGVYLLRVVASTSARQESAVLKAVVWNED